MENYTVTFVAYLTKNAKKYENLYICGNCAKLGNWNPEKAVPLKKTKCGNFRLSRKFPVDSHIEYKLLAGKDWKYVEKGIYGEEIANHSQVVEGNTVSPVVITFFAE